MSFENAGLVFKSYRKSISMTQLELSKKSKVHSQFVSNWERGKCLPPVPVMKKIYKSMTEAQKVNFKDAIQQDLTPNDEDIEEQCQSCERHFAYSCRYVYSTRKLK